MKKEVTDQKDNNKLLVVPKSEVPKEAKVLPAVYKIKVKEIPKSERLKIGNQE